MRNGDASSAVRILPADGSAPIGAGPPPEPPRPQRWFLPLVVVVGMLGIFVVATRPTQSGSEVPTTQPAPIAAIDADVLDFVAVTTNNSTHDWVSEALGGTSQINDVLRSGSSFVAVGSDSQGAHVWLSSTGGHWRDVLRFEVPENPKSSIGHAVNWDGGIVALGSVGDGVGLWTASYASNWTYQGQIAAFGKNRIRDLAAGSELLAVSAGNEGVLGWMSSDGLQWRPLGTINDLNQVALHGIAATDDWFFAFGEEDCATPCSAVIYRSADGISWDAVTEGLGADSRGVTGIAQTPNGLLAMGWVNGPAGTAIAIWESIDGSTWTRIAADSPALQSSSTTFQLLSARPGDNPVAEVSVSGTTAEVTIGTQISTDVGTVVVSDISDSSIALTQGDGARPIKVIDTSTITAIAVPRSVTAEGPRIVITGHMRAGNSDTPAVWISQDAGVTWVRQMLEPEGYATHVAATAGVHITAVGTGPEGQFTWRAAWDTAKSAAAAEVVVSAYLGALNNKDEEHLVGLLPKTNEGDIRPSFMVPSLGEAVHSWWNPDTGRLDRDRVTETLDYLKATTTSIEVGDCTSSASLGVVDRINVRCEYAVDSSLLTLFNRGGSTGHINALLRNGVLTTITLDASPSINMWQVLSSRLNGSEIRDLSAPPAATVAPIEFSRSTAAEHLELAEALLAGVLAPGTSTTVETPLGTMEWTWLSGSESDPQNLHSIAWSDVGFVATGYGDPSASTPSLTAWKSIDGVGWTEIDTPDAWDGLWEIQAFNGGVIGVVSQSATVGLAFYDGADWTEIPLDQPDDVSYLDVVRLAVSGNRAMAVSGWWREDGLLLNEAVLIGPDLIAQVVTLPDRDSWTEIAVQLAGSDTGFVLGASNYYSQNPELSIWHTTDGLEWTQLAESSPLGDAQFVWNLQRHRSRYFVVGEGAELRCSTTAQGENCVSLIQLWSSPDGVAWDRVITESGEPVSTYEIGSGPLGLVAFGQELAGSTFPRSVFFSTDGATWDTSGGLTLLNPDSSWWYIDTPAVGNDTVVAVGSSYQDSPNEQSEQAFRIIGRLIDG